MKIKPPKKTFANEKLERLKKEFIESDSIEEIRNEIVDKSKYPWEKDNIDEKRNINYPLRLDEVTHAKIKYISDKTSIPMSKLLKNIIDPWVSSRVMDIVKNETVG
jgi:hypothetical protein